jgi:hypothetical protein
LSCTVAKLKRNLLNFRDHLLIPYYNVRYPKFKGNEVVIFHVGRCGSTYLSELLNNHPEIHSLGELNSCYRKKYYSSKETPQRKIKKSFRRSKAKYSILEIKGEDDLGILNLSLNELVFILESLKIHVFLLKRDNLFNIYISMALGWERKKRGESAWHFRNTNVSVEKIILNPDDANAPWRTPKRNLIEVLDYFNGFNYNLLRFIKEENVIIYERDLQKNNLIAVNKILKLWNLSLPNLKVSLVKINNKSTNEVVSNYDEVKEYLKNSQYFWMI